MKQLAKLQRNFQHGLLEGSPNLVVPAINATGRARPELQLEVYANAYYMRLREVLQLDYPGLLATLGNDTFEALADAYIAAHPSRGYSLRDFGARLSGFMRNQTDYSERPTWAEMAEFEWCLGVAFDANDDPLVTTGMMNDLPFEAWPDIRFVFHASVQKINFAWNTPALWNACKTNIPTPEVQEYTPSAPWLIWRQDQKVQFRSLENDETVLFNAARQGDTFAEMCDVMSTVVSRETVPIRAVSLLKRWISDGMISQII